MVDQQDVHSKQQAAQQHQRIARPQAETALHAQQVQPGHRQRHAGPQPRARPLAGRQAQHRHQHDVQRRDEPRLAHRGKPHAELLGRGGGPQCHAAAHTARQQRFFLPGRHRPPRAAARQLVQQRDAGKQHHPADQKARRVKGERAHMLHPHALGHKSRAPNKRREQQYQRIQAKIPLFILPATGSARAPCRRANVVKTIPRPRAGCQTGRCIAAVKRVYCG